MSAKYAKNLQAKGIHVIDHVRVIAECGTHWSSITIDEDLANARLFAAAPDLVDALQTCHDVLSLMWGTTDPLATAQQAVLNKARRAIQKAVE